MWDYDAELDLVPKISRELSKEPDIIITNPEKMGQIWRCITQEQVLEEELIIK